MTPKITTLKAASEATGIPYEPLRIMACYGRVPGATQRGKGTHWKVDPEAFERERGLLMARWEHQQKHLGAEVQKQLPGVDPAKVMRGSCAAARDEARKAFMSKEWVEKNLIPTLDKLALERRPYEKPTGQEVARDPATGLPSPAEAAAQAELADVRREAAKAFVERTKERYAEGPAVVTRLPTVTESEANPPAAPWWARPWVIPAGALLGALAAYLTLTTGGH